MRIASRVKHWVEPFLHRTLVMSRTSRPADLLPSCRVETFMDIVRTQKASFLRDSVRNLMLYCLSAHDTRAVLYFCVSVENLYIVSGGGDLQPALDTMPLRNLHCDLNSFVNLTPFEPFHHDRSCTLSCFTGWKDSILGPASSSYRS
ncbi:hypothetical protein C8R44DRAFT_249949 [Mycena epipterygia]|nr:hypothetical protein C8R44DRAFT_249949 [Mycena epipterygia]